MIMIKKYRLVLTGVIIVAFAALFANYFVAIERIDAGCVGIKVNLVGDNRGVDDIPKLPVGCPICPCSLRYTSSPHTHR